MKIGLRLTLSFFLIAFLSILVIGIMSYIKGKKALEEESFNKLTAVREMKAEQIEYYFQELNEQIIALSNDQTFIDAMKQFKQGFQRIDTDLGITDNKKIQRVDSSLTAYFENIYLKKLNTHLVKKATLETELSQNKNCRILQNLYIATNPNLVGSKLLLDNAGDSSTYTKVHKKFHPVIRNFLEQFSYYDVFLIDEKTGNIVYTVFKEVDFGTSLLTGPFKATNIANAFLAANASTKKGFVKMVDFQPYNPSYNEHASFIASAIYDGEEKIGVLIFQVPISEINEVMTSHNKWSKVGLGKTGETYIVGEDYTLRNQSRFLMEDSSNYFRMIREKGLPINTVEKIRAYNNSIGLQVVITEGTIAALKGTTGYKIFPDYRGEPVLSSFKPLNIAGQDMRWVIMSEIDEAEAFESVHNLKRKIIAGSAGFVLLVVILSFFISKRITQPIKELTYSASLLAKGKLDAEIKVRGMNSKDEVGILALSFRKMQVSINKLVEDLKDINQNLENKVIERTHEIHRQKEMVEEKNKEIVDSINYALRLQRAILPPIEKVKESLPQSFILFKPKDIVSGDFYWLHDLTPPSASSGQASSPKGEGGISSKILIAAVDCTGHGVPGAMVSVVGANGLNRCVKEFGLKEPSSILDKLTDLIIETFETHDHDVKDGMDIALCAVDLKTNKVEYAGANNPLWIVRKNANEIEEIKANKQPIGKHEYRKHFTNHSVSLNEGDCFYIFTDGYADQFGGPKGKKFKSAALKKLLVSINEKDMAEQMVILHEEIENWRGNLEQVDDVCVIGVKI